MNAIKFSHTYCKMPAQVIAGDHRTFLVGVSIDDLSSLPSEFLSWDTEYYEDVKIKGKNITESKHYMLPKGRCLLLTLFTMKSDDVAPECLWTTIRRWTPDKEKYYLGLIGSPVEIEFTEEGK